ncbi:MAG: 50S ribosomal protein L20 [Planctomycetes bacterium]|nr:50S ribosomal protein L20 [Planctomycetota bacterium]
MVRATNGPAKLARHKRVLKAAKGFRGGRSKLYRTAKVAVMRAGRYAYRDRRVRKRQMRRLWIVRLNAAARARGLRYSMLVYGLLKAKVELDRKQLSEMAINDAAAFDAVCEQAKAALAAP